MRDAGRFSAAVQEASTRLFRTAYLLCGDALGAGELLADAVSRAHRRWWWLRPRRQPALLVRRALVRLAVRELQDPVDGGHSRDPGAGPGLGPSPGLPGWRREEATLDRVLATELLAQPTRARIVLVLRYWEGLADPEIAAELGWSLRTVERWSTQGLHALHRAALRATPAAHEDDRPARQPGSPHPPGSAREAGDTYAAPGRQASR